MSVFRKICFLFGLLVPITLFGQGFIQNGGHVVMQNNPSIVIDGTQGHYLATTGSLVTVTDTGNILVPGNWTNNSGDAIFTRNGGRVNLTGSSQNIQGTDLTAFPTLSLEGSADKYLLVDALVGGGHSGGGKGALLCNNHLLWLQSHQLTVNNSSTQSVQTSSGGIVSETDFAAGYGQVQWNIRNRSGNFVLPFQTTSGQDVSHTVQIGTAGSMATDSGFFRVATYPTDPIASPNNRALPNTVADTDNEYGRENADKLLDRFWVVDVEGYSMQPQGNHVFGYRDLEWDASSGSTNDITEANLRPVNYNSGWSYPGSGTTDVAQNRTTGGSNELLGIWTLADTTVCPVADFVWTGNCEQEPILFDDQSTINPGTIESWKWVFGDGGNSSLEDPPHTYSTSGAFLVELVVVGNSGCPDTLNRSVQVDARAIADFSFDDDPLVSYPVTFTENTQNSSDWLWDFGDLYTGSGSIVTHTYEDEGTFNVMLIANNPANCPDTIVKPIEVNQPSLFLIPDAFTPGDRDELNRTIGLVTLQRVTEYNFQVYNRWGELIFTSDDPSKKWDGTYQKVNCPMGSYMYIMTFRDRKFRQHNLKGTFLLLR